MVIKPDASHYAIMIIMLFVGVVMLGVGYARGRNTAWYESQRELSSRIGDRLLLIQNGTEDNTELSFGDYTYVAKKTDLGVLLTRRK
jgi:hypothetical protein